MSATRSSANSGDSAVRMTSGERHATFALAGIFALRMFGLFLVIPVLALHARDLPGASAFSVGLAIGIYGACQAIFQIPFGMASDRFGRRQVITLGLVIFLAGSVVAGLASTVEWIIIGRALQGAGAVAAAVLALTADLTRETVRTRAMAVIGVSIGGSFMLALMAGPALVPHIGVPGLFFLTATLAAVAIVVLWTLVPTVRVAAAGAPRGSVMSVLRSGALLRLDIGMFTIHAALMALFVVIPQQLVDVLSLAVSVHWKLYVPVLFASVIPFAFLVHRSHGGGASRQVLRVAVVLVLLSQVVLLASGAHIGGIALALIVFFAGFNTLEALLPSMVSTAAPRAHRGAALGVFNTCQFAGVFTGGVAGGLILARFGAGGVYWLVAALAGVWLVMLLMEKPADGAAQPLRKLEIRVGPRTPVEASQLEARLAGYDGVVHATVSPIEGLATLEVDPGRFDMRLLDEFVETVNLRIRS